MSPSLWSRVMFRIWTTLSWGELLHKHTRTSYESLTSVLIRIQERWRCPAPCSNSCRSLLPSSAQFDRRVNTDAEQQTRDHFISDDSPACCRNWTNSTGNYLAVINWQGEEWRGNSVMDILKGVNAFSSDIKILCCLCKFRNKVKKKKKKQEAHHFWQQTTNRFSTIYEF